MAWGLWNKIKQGFKKVGNAIKTGVTWVKDKIIKPVTEKVIKPFKPIIGAAASAYNPKVGAAVNAGMGVLEKISDEGFGSATKDVISMAQSGGFTPFKRLK